MPHRVISFALVVLTACGGSIPVAPPAPVLDSAPTPTAEAPMSGSEGRRRAAEEEEGATTAGAGLGAAGGGGGGGGG